MNPLTIEIDQEREKWHTLIQNNSMVFSEELCEGTLSLLEKLKKIKPPQPDPLYQHYVLKRAFKLSSVALTHLTKFQSEFIKRIKEISQTLFNNRELGSILAVQVSFTFLRREKTLTIQNYLDRLYPEDKAVLERKVQKWKRTLTPIQCDNPLPNNYVKKEPNLSVTTSNGVFIASTIGRRDFNEDRTLTATLKIREKETSVFAVFDGSGGDQTADWAKDNFLSFLEKSLTSIDLNSPEEIALAFKILGPKMQSAIETQDFSITTVVAAVVLNNRLWVLNLGDSRALLVSGDEGACLTVDARADHPSYKKSVYDRCGKIWKEGHIVRLYGGQMPARSLSKILPEGGSSRFKISWVDLSDLRECQLYLSSDGAFEADPSDGVEQISVDQWLYFAKSLPVETVVEQLVHYAHLRTDGGKERRSYDNITIMGTNIQF